MPIGELSAILAALAWAIGSLLYGLIGRRASAGTMNAGKLLTGVVVLAAARLAWTGSAWPAGVSRWDLGLLAVSGLIGLAVGDTAYFGAIRAVGAPRALLILSAAPVIATGLGLMLGERLTGLDVAGIVVTLLGIVLVIYRRPDATASSRAALGRGVALAVLAAACQAVGAVLARKAMQGGVDPLGASVIRLAVGLCGMVVVGSMGGQARMWLAELGQDRNWAKIAGAALIGTCIGVFLSLVALSYSRSVGVASTLLATSPVFVLPMAHAFRIEKATLRGVVGTLVAVAGVALLAWP